ncbi:MAG: lipid A biosynthesis acyltransferase [Sulfuricellaceae bacterium]|nr:lipid A biosynthesis acyltransferase [Sulfuricellaceae bacterium]
MMARVGIFLIWLLHFLPLPVLAGLGRGLGWLLYAFARERRRVARINLRLCFPGRADAEREKLVRRQFQAFGRSLLERGLAWWSRPQRLRRIVRVVGREHLEAQRGRPVILFAPHFVGLDMGWIRLTLDDRLASMYSVQKNPAFDRRMLAGRRRFKQPLLLSRQQGLRPIVKALKDGLPFYYLPDMDYGPRDALFVPFFGVPAATITGLPRLAGMVGAAVIPCITRQLPGGQGYEVKFYPAWENYPAGDMAADVRRMNAFLEERVEEMPEQYFWLHKRFKTRPEGEARFYR